MTDNDKYEMTEEDIDKVLYYLKLINPKRATPETAIAILERMATRVGVLEHFDKEAVEKILENLEEY